MSTTITTDQVRHSLSQVKDPEIGKTLLELGMIKDIAIDGVNVTVTVELTTAACPLKSTIESDCRQAVTNGIPEAGAVTINLTARDQETPSELLPGVKNIIAVGSGKGGVGKSTVSANLAVALTRLGHKVGLLDMDFYGPSIPAMLGIAPDHKPTVKDDRIIPVEKHGVHVISIGFFLEEESPVIWRAPMVHAALKQFIEDVNWGELDYLILDLPPGTGDIQLSMVHMLPVTGALIVSTPQDMALLDAKKAVSMFQACSVEVLGIVENMSYHICPQCQHQSYLFGEKGARKYADERKIPFLGDLPLEFQVREAGDEGNPFYLALDEENHIHNKFHRIATNLKASVDVRNQTKPAPQPLSAQSASGCGGGHGH
ncbi:Mrp/NBP35 family ATP-binding protein [Desulfurispira natronophila]|uniref:Iron-sulfur cluster carrier protein n=1 Tax=Desulfurispira natronophila TaxID=682562 RepID=A0A7W8DGG8_9BACT|nr:Mrp/NBP35 family ATP-binding protein [Desulfurispira natronophila]MBB5021228.1 ATP-binding protein involved in chromosome partitioning [Desulfurispira natronophila]